MSAQTTAFIPACANVHWFKLMYKHTVMCEHSNLHMLHHHLNCQVEAFSENIKLYIEPITKIIGHLLIENNQLELDPELNGRVRKPS